MNAKYNELFSSSATTKGLFNTEQEPIKNNKGLLYLDLNTFEDILEFNNELYNKYNTII